MTTIYGSTGRTKQRIFMVLEHFTNLDRSLFDAEYNILTWRFMSLSSSDKYWLMRISKYRT